MSYNSTLYDEEYYATHLGTDYSRGNGWEEVFSRDAELIKRDFQPEKTLDVGCAVGYLVEGLRDLGIEAYGIDISEYAISQAREDIKPYCSVQSATDVIEGKYDLISCIEVLEHLSLNDIKKAISNICKATDTVIFSSTPFDYDEETHFSVNKAGFWSEEFAANGFYHDLDYDCSYIAPQCVLYRRRDYSKNELIRNYENKCFEIWNQNCVLRNKVNIRVAQITDLDKEKADLAKNLEDLKVELDQIKKERSDNYANAIKGYYEKYDAEHDKVLEQQEYIEFLQQELGKAQIYSNKSSKKKLGFWDKYKTTRKMLKKPMDYWAPVFDADLYLKYNKDIAGKIGDSPKELLKHFIKEGMYEARRASDTFDIKVYLQYNQDVEELFGHDLRTCYRHYIEDGIKEGRRAI